MDPYLRKKIKYKINTVIICFVLLIIFTTLTMLSPENKTKYYDTVEEKFGVEFLTENNNTDKDNYIKLINDYTYLVQDLNTSFSNVISNINLINSEDDTLVADISFSQIKESFPEYKDEVLKAELFKRGYLTKDDKIFPIEKDFDKYNSYLESTFSHTIDISDVKSYGINAEEIERYFKVTKMKDNVILLFEDEYNNPNIEYDIKTIYIIGKTLEDKIIIYGEYPLKLNVFDISFMNL